MGYLAEFLTELSEAVFPSGIYCNVCGSMIDRSRPYALCDGCMTKMHWINGMDGHGICSKCGKDLPETYKGERCYDCMNREHRFTKGFSCLTYGLYERQLMMDIKYSGKGYMASKMGDIMYDRLAPEVNLIGSKDLFDHYNDGTAGRFCGSREGIVIDLVLPVPVSAGRLEKRGYNQSALMARQLVKRWNEELDEVTELSNGIVRAPRCDENILYRAQETVMLRSLNPAERRLALEGAFKVKSETVYRIKGKNILLIDDIYTTGATCDACSEALISAGAGSVYVLTLCSGGNRRPADM